MPRWFNTTGPCDPTRHYMLSSARRLPELPGLIEHQEYFVLHAPRQVGKTTALLALASELTKGGRYAAALVSTEMGAPFPDDIGEAEGAMLESWRRSLEFDLPAELRPPPWPDAEPGARIGAALSAWAQASPRPIVLFLDEIDALQGKSLLSVLRQLRDGFRRRPHGFPSSLALIGMRDVRDYKIASGGSDRLASSSPFNIKADSLTMGNFTNEEVADLYQQHTSDTGQQFLPEAIARAFELTQGQPWLVNALARQLVEKLIPDRATAITARDVETAKEVLIQRQDTHLDSLIERLREERVRHIVEPILAGGTMPDVPSDDIRFVVDLGLLRRSPQGGLEPANPIYKEVILRALANGPRDALPQISPSWCRDDGSLDEDKLLGAFLAFWRQHGEPLMGSAAYHEIAPHLVLMAFLHRVVNGGGTIEREYAAGTRRMDLCLRHRELVLPIELKVWRDGEQDPLAEGLEQIEGYLASVGAQRGWLVIFDRRAGQPRIAERTGSERAVTASGRVAVVVRA